MNIMLLILAIISLVMIILAIVVTATRPFHARRRGAFGPGFAVFVYITALAQIFVCALCFYLHFTKAEETLSYETIPTTQAPVETKEAPATSEPTEPTETEVPETEAPTTVPTEPPDPRTLFAPYASESSNPENFGIQWEIFVNDAIVESYSREDPISFELDTTYFPFEGVGTFRGNNYRDNPAYGIANVAAGKLAVTWKHGLGRYNEWGGCAWTGQPLVIRWDAETKAIMNMYDSKKEKEDLVEVIYATLDGNIHFYDMADGTKTRDDLFMGMNFKGAGALDPRGYPLLYVGSGVNNGGKRARMFIISLIDGSILYEWGHAEPLTLRDWSAFDSSPLVDKETDTLIWPGENGILYTMKLNTQYDQEAGTISVSPDNMIRARYTSTYSEAGRYLGFEPSSVIVDHYLFISENGGLFFCIDLNTMELVWAQDTKDDSNSTPLFEWDEEGNGYLYTAPSLHWTAQGHEGEVSVYKLNAENGEIIWEYTFPCVRYDDLAGGVQASPLIGRAGTEIEGMIIYPLARTPSAYKGNLTALNKETGEVIWEVSTGNYAWSSPAAFYTEDGQAYIFIANASGVCKLLDGATGDTLTTIDFKQTIEASPVIFDNMMVIGTREGVYGLKIS